jgi:hypothetical protein
VSVLTVRQDYQVMRRMTRDDEPDDRVGDLEADGDEDGGCEDGEADESVRAGVVAVGDERWAVEAAAGAEADDGGEFVVGEADGADDRECDQVLDVLRVDEPVDGLDGGDTGAEERSWPRRSSRRPFRRARSVVRRRRRAGAR